MHRQHHRGPHPGDAARFGPAAVPTLQRAAEELHWLLTRGYSLASALTLVGDRHQLDARQRLALHRGCCSDGQRTIRGLRELAASAFRDARALVDGFNLIVTLEVAIGGGVLIEGEDHCLRDLAGLRGSYRTVDETPRAIELAFRALGDLAVREACWLLDRGVSNSGRLKKRLLDAAQGQPFACDVQLVADPDPLLAASAHIVTSDGPVLDQCESWFNLARAIVVRDVPDAFRVPLRRT